MIRAYLFSPSPQPNMSAFDPLRTFAYRATLLKEDGVGKLVKHKPVEKPE